MFIALLPSEQSLLHFRISLIHGSETPIGANDHQPLQHTRALDEELEEGELAVLPSETMEHQKLDVRLYALDGTGLQPELEVELASGFINFFRLQNRTNSYCNKVQRELWIVQAAN